MLRIKWEPPYKDSFVLRQIIGLSKKITEPLSVYSTEYGELYDLFTKELQEAFDGGREFERSYKPDSD